MTQEDFVPRFCDACGEPKNEFRDGSEIIKRCTCDWERGFHERLRSTVHPDYYRDKVIRISDWSPPPFKDGGAGRFKSLIKVQKANALIQMYEYCFRVVKRDENGKRYALEQSIDSGRNLFIRGPAGSGRGLLLSQIKILAAMRDISTTPNPGDWATFKNIVAQAHSYRRDGELAKHEITGQFKVVKLLALENLRSENSSVFFDEKRPPKRFHAADMINELLVKRSLMPGTMVLSSSEFIREIGDSMGDKLPEILTSERTMLILLFSAIEADALLAALHRQIDSLRITAKQALPSASTLQANIERERKLEEFEQLLYLEYLFPNVPALFGKDNFNSEDKRKILRQDKTEEDGLTEGSEADGLSPEKKQIIANFRAEQKLKGLAFQEKTKKYLLSAVNACKELASKMTDKEMLDAGRMMSIACSDVEDINTYIAKAAQLREKMVTE